MTSNRLLPWLGGLAVILAAVGCTGGSEQEAAAKAVIASFQANPAEIAFGETSRLSWQTTGATRVQVAEVGGDTLDLGAAPASNGAVDVTPGSTTTYELRAFNADDKATTRTVEVKVAEAPALPVIGSFTATPSEVQVGGEVTLAWTTEHADAVAIHDAAGRAVDLAGAAVAAGQVKLAARESTTFRITASGPGGEAEASASVAVKGAPAVSVTAPVNPILPGDNATISWSTQNATRVQVVDESGTILFEGADKVGSVRVNPEFTTRYSVVATGVQADASASVLVLVRPVIDRFAVTTPGPVHAGEEVELAWHVRGARSLLVSKVGAPAVKIAPEGIAEGTLRMIAGADGVFKLAAQTGSLLTETSASVELDRSPFVREISFNPPVVSASEDTPAAVTVSWMVDGATRVELEQIPGGPIPVNGLSPRADSTLASVTRTTTFRVKATNDFGTSIGEAVLNAYRAPVIESFTALPARAEVGESIQLAWSTTDTSRVVIEKDGIALPVTDSLVNGTFTDTVFTDSSYVLHVWNPAGFEVISQPVAVHIGAPEIVSFAADHDVAQTGLPLVFNWQNEGGQTVTITDEAGATICSVTDLTRIAAGSCQTTGPVPGQHQYTLHLVSGIGTEVTSTISIESTDGPIVRAFAGNDALITVTEPVVLSWTVTADAAGTTPSLALTDDHGNSYALGNADPFAGTATVQIPAPGLYTLTLTAQTAGTTADTATFTVDARGVPAIAGYTATPEVVDTAGTGTGSSALAWTSQYGVSLAIFEADASGNRGANALYTTTDVAEIAAGTTNLSLAQGVHPLLLVVGNGAGAEAEGLVTVMVDPAQALTFTATPNEVLNGETVTLAWTSHNATTASIGGLPFTVGQPVATAITAPFIDVAGQPGATQLTFTSNDDASTVATFPAGFTFPWDGANATGVRVSTNGTVSFATATTGNPYSNVTLPSSTSSNQMVNLAPFWDDLHLVPYTGAAPGQVWVASGSDDEGAFVVVEWKNHYWRGATSGGGVDLNFEVVLRENGVFEYRYGTMAGGTRSDGDSATIGFQNRGGTVGTTLSNNTPIAGGLSNKAWRFDGFALPASGNVDVVPRGDVTFPLVVSNGYSSDSLAASVTWHPAVVINSATVAPAQPVINTDITIAWNTTNATAVQVVDTATGTVRCTAAADQLNIGNCVIRETAEGSYGYTVRATGAIPRDVQTQAVTTYVYRPFSLDTFTTSAAMINEGQSLTLSWTATGAATVSITENGTPLNLAGKNPNADSFTYVPVASATYVMTITDAPASGTPRTPLTATRSVTVRTTQLNTATASATQVAPGGSSTISWTSTGADTVLVSGATVVSSDVSATNTFVDVSATGTRAIDSSGGDGPTAVVNLPAGFTFPFGGAARNAMKISGDGFISFDTTSGNTYSNSQFPTTSYPQVHLAPFWDDLHTKTTGEVWWSLVTPTSGPRYVVVEWKAYGIYTSTANPASLNFEVLLFEDGTWEFRYGSMTATTQARADGSEATLGWQLPGGTMGYTISHNTAVAGGLSNRAWRFDPRQANNGSVTVTPTKTTTYVVCAAATGFMDCRNVTVRVVAPGDVMITEVMTAPAAPVGNPAGEWFEVRNVADYAIDINGWIIGSDAADGTHTINNGGPMVLQPGEYKVFSRGDATVNGGIAGTWVYGSGITFDEAATDSVKLTYGTAEIDKVEWGTTWAIPSGKSLSLDPSYQTRDVTKNDLLSSFCQSAVAYDGVNTGSPGTTGAGCRYANYDLDPAGAKPFIDITATGTDIPGLNVDNAVVQLPGGLGFTTIPSFPYFGGTATSAWVSTNGWLSFDSQTASTYVYSNPNIPSTSNPNRVVAAFWDDLVPNADGSTVKTELRTVNGMEVRIVQWNNWKQANAVGTLTVQAQLWANGDIVTVIRNANPGDPTNASQVNYYAGSSATFGLEDSGASTGNYILFSYNSATMWSGRSLHYKRK